jgi:transglutaminase-like putative cysteine protease
MTMRFGVVHRTMTGLLAAMGILAVVASGELNRWASVALILGLVGSFFFPEEWHGKPWLHRIANALQVGLLLLQIVRCYFFNQPLLEVAVEFAVALQIIRLATRRGAAHDQHVIMLALIHLIAGTVLGASLSYGLCFLGFLVVAPGALMLSHLRREVEGNYRQGARDRTGLPVDVPRILRSRRVVGRPFLAFTCSLALPILLFTSLLFLLFPRVELSFLQLTRPQKSRVIGFDDHVDLGGVGELRANSSVALYADLPDLPEPPPDRIALHLRGTAFDTFDGKAWSRSNAEWRAVERPRDTILLERQPDPASDRLLRFDLDPYDPPILFLPRNAVAFSVRARSEMASFAQPLRVERGPEGQFRYRASSERGIHYQVWVSTTPLPPRPLPPEERARYLHLPPLPPRIASLAHDWTADKPTPFDRASAIEQRLRSEFRYDLASPSGSFPDPLDHFLFESKRGHCEYYSSAMAIMLRQIGIPSRNVTGYVGGQYNRFSRNYVVRQRDAHSWVEAYLDGMGWVTFDPTPPAFSAPRSEQGVVPLLRDVLDASNQRWDRYIIRYDIRRQLSLLDRVQGDDGARRGQGLGFPRPQHLLALLGTSLAAWAVVALARRWRPRRVAPLRSVSPLPSREAIQAVHLYEALESALALQGLGRPQGVPPLQHAQSASVQRHPMGEEILALTQLYQELRFGGAPLAEEKRRRFEQGIKLIRSYRSTSGG